MINVLFVCMGNICRSPTAEGVFRQVVENSGLSSEISIDSAGTHAYHVGEQPDSRAQASARKRGIDLSSQRARKVQHNDFSSFDYILAMDADNHAELLQLANGSADGSADNLHMFLKFSRNFDERDVPDPYYGGDQGFEHVLNLVEDASLGLLEHIRKQHNI